MTLTPLRHLKRPLTALAVAAAALLPAVAANAPASATDPSVNPQHWYLADGSLHGAAGRCAPATDRVFTGTVLGADGLGVNVNIGFDMKDDNGNTIDLATGCAAKGYSTIIQMNHDVSFAGAPVGSPTTPSNFAATNVVTDRYEIRGIPANIVSTYMETYVRNPTGSACGWNCAGDLDVTKYGEVNRRAVPISTGGVNITLPLTTRYGGKTGTIEVTVKDAQGNLVGIRAAHAWSMILKDGSRSDQGWGNGVTVSKGVDDIPSLASGQDYIMDIVTTGGTFVRTLHLPVSTGQTLDYTVDADGPRRVNLAELPASRVRVTRVGKAQLACSESARGLQMSFTCTAPTAAVFSIPTLYRLASGSWIAANRTRVAGNHTFTLHGFTKYKGTMQWRIDAGGKRDSFTVVSS